MKGRQGIIAETCGAGWINFLGKPNINYTLWLRHGFPRGSCYVIVRGIGALRPALSDRPFIIRRCLGGPMRTDPLRILVVEDDYFLAERLARDIRANGDTVVGPFADVHEAIHRVGLVQGAILDVKIQDETSFSVADSLIHHGVPMLFLTGYHPQVVPDRFARRHIYAKPSDSAPLLHDLHEQHHKNAFQETDSIEMVVMEVIRQAKIMMPDAASAERLVEAVLLRAIAETRETRIKGEIRACLLALLDDEYRQRGRRHLH